MRVYVLKGCVRHSSHYFATEKLQSDLQRATQRRVVVQGLVELSKLCQTCVYEQVYVIRNYSEDLARVAVYNTDQFFTYKHANIQVEVADHLV